jgi:hypothetical protein
MKQAEIIDYILKKPGYNPQQIVLINAGEKKLGFAYCPRDGIYQIVSKDELPGLERTIKDGSPKTFEIDALRIKPILDLAEQCNDESDRLVEISDLVYELLLSINTNQEENQED